MNSEILWWKDGVIYQIYPRSFYDTNHDGIGDLPGIIEKLDYLSYLGIDAIWLSPINSSPMEDFGYDIKSYREIDPAYGTLYDFDCLVKEAHACNIRIILDLVMNHTSDLHHWFLESRSSRHNPKRDWYIWHDGIDGKPPNNWLAAFGGSAWEWDEETRQFYLHSFLKEQPDLNWRNPAMKQAMFQKVGFWLDKGVDGFRLDVVNWFIKDSKLRNNPYTIGYSPRKYDMQKHIYDRNRPETHDVLQEFRDFLDSYDDRMAVGEVFSGPPGDQELSASFLSGDNDELHLSFDFSLLYQKWSARKFYNCIANWYTVIPPSEWPCFVLSNHDQPRSISRWKKGNELLFKAKVAATLLLTLKGTPFLYYGEEIGMRDGSIARKDLADPLGKKYWPFFKGRDPSRTPMQWSHQQHAGFTTGSPWLPVNDDYKEVNVQTQLKDQESLFHLYRTLILLRRDKKALRRGDWIPLTKGTHDILSYFRICEEQRLLIVLNFSAKYKKTLLGVPPGLSQRGCWKIIFSTHKKVNQVCNIRKMDLLPFEATILEREKEKSNGR
jgi:alpha-glucosidase